MSAASETSPSAPIEPQPSPKRKRVLLKWSLAATALLLAYGMWQCGSALTQGVRSSDAAVAHFHSALNACHFDEIYAQSDPVFRESGTREDTIKLAAVHTKLGNAGQATRGGINVNTNMKGTFVTVSYETTYEHASADETFVWRKGISGELKLVGYNIQSKAFIIQ